MLYVNKRLMLLADTVMSLEKITVMGPGPVMTSWSLPSDRVMTWTWEMPGIAFHTVLGFSVTKF